MVREYGIEELMASEFFTYSLVWLLTFAIIYGILDAVKIPKTRPTRGIISIVIAFLILPAAAPVVMTITKMASNLIILITGLLIFIILIELTGIKVKTAKPVGVEGGVPIYRKVSVYERYARGFGILFIIIAILIFVSSGGLGVLGLEKIGLPSISISPSLYPLLFFLVIMALLIFWMLIEKEEEKTRPEIVQ